MKKYSKGFTLIGLLVVIAIIGILSSVVLASLSTARSKGKDASAKTSLSSVRNAMEMYYIGAGANAYGAVGAGTMTSGGTPSGLTGGCTDGDVTKLIKAAAAQAGQTLNCTIGFGGTSYEADVQLNDTTIFCVDSSGFSGVVPSAGISRAVTTGTTAKCK